MWMTVPLDRLTIADNGPPQSIAMDRLGPDHIRPTFTLEALPLIAEAFSDRSWDDQSVSQRVLDPDTLRRLIVARDTERLVGLTTVHSTTKPTVARLHWLAVAESHRRLGIGRALVVAAAEEAGAAGFSEMTLKTESYRTAAIALYRRLGFTTSA
jgi:ribosomal protein S18 acetylase RimI-like enzyme